MRSDFKTIINADDLGYDIAINKAILESFRRSLITRASLMVNMSGFEDAIHLIQTHPFLPGNIGLHLNLTEGYPLTEAIRNCSRFCDASGRFIYKRQNSLFFLSRREKKAVYQEIKAQIEKAIHAGVLLSHLDSHHHVHTEWAILRLSIRLGKEYNVRNIRKARNMGREPRPLKMVYKSFLNRYLKNYPGITVTDYFGDTDDLALLLKKGVPVNRSIEIMVHPKFDDNQELVDLDGKNLQQKLDPLLEPRPPVAHIDDL